MVLLVVAVLIVMPAAKAGAEAANRERAHRWAQLPPHLVGPDSNRHPLAGELAQAPPELRRPGSAAAPPRSTLSAPAAPMHAAAAPIVANRRPAQPTAAATQASPAEPAARPAVPPPGERIDINSASVDELEQLPGVGVRAAERIAGHRERHGPFASVEGLEAVEGFDRNRISRLARHATV